MSRCSSFGKTEADRQAMTLLYARQEYGRPFFAPPDVPLQPFRFVTIAADDQRRLGSLILERSRPSKAEQDWIEKLRAASAQNAAPRPWRFKLAGAVGLLTVGLGTAAYLLHFGLLK